MAFPLWSGGSALWTDPLELVLAGGPNLAPHLPAERTKPRVPNLAGFTIFIGTRSIGLISSPTLRFASEFRKTRSFANELFAVLAGELLVLPAFPQTAAIPANEAASHIKRLAIVGFA